MKTLEVPAGSLQELRIQKGYTLEGLAQALAEKLSEQSRSSTSIHKIMREGSDRLSIIDALADLLDTDREGIIRAMQVSKDYFSSK